MEAQKLLVLLRDKGVKLFVREGQLSYRAPKGVMTPGLVRLLKANKLEIIDILEEEQENQGEVDNNKGRQGSPRLKKRKTYNLGNFFKAFLLTLAISSSILLLIGQVDGLSGNILRLLEEASSNILQYVSGPEEEPPPPGREDGARRIQDPGREAEDRGRETAEDSPADTTTPAGELIIPEESKEKEEPGEEFYSRGPSFIIRGVTIGDSEGYLLQQWGPPVRKDLSQYGFQWYVYNRDYGEFIMAGVQGGRVVGLYTNTGDWASRQGVSLGTPRQEVLRLLGEPLEYLVKGNTRYYYGDTRDYSLFYLDNYYYAAILFDVYQDDRVSAVQLVRRDVEMSLEGYYGRPGRELGESFRRQCFDLANAARALEGLPPLAWDEQAAAAAQRHSGDMKEQDFFEHVNPRGETPFDRLAQEGVQYFSAAENIAAGQVSAIFAHQGWMNSPDHRQNILGDFERMGSGVEFGGTHQVYYTQKFYVPRGD